MIKATEELIAKAKLMLAAGQTKSAIAASLEVTRATLDRWLSAEPTQESKPVVEPVSAAQEPTPVPVPVPATGQPADDRPRCEPYHIEAVAGGGRIECRVPGLKLVDFYR